MAAPADWLTQPVTVINLGRRGLAPLIWRDSLGLAGMAFCDAQLADAHLARLRHATRRGGAQPEAQLLAADDLRAREEWLWAVHAAGAARVLFDFDPLTSGGDDALTAALLAEVLSHKRGLACL
jgi:hypothetical protein